MHERSEAIHRRMVRRTRIACVILGSIMHVIGTIFVLMWQTSCLDPPCADSIGFDMARGLAGVPLFVTPWLALPSPELDFVGGWPLFALMLLNATLAVLFYWGLARLVRRGYVRWRINRSRAS
jgi:hypothetical protein